MHGEKHAISFYIQEGTVHNIMIFFSQYKKL